MANKARGRKSIFITGAASGMGRETAKLFHAKGWFVGAFDVNTDGLKTLEQELGSDNCFTHSMLRRRREKGPRCEPHWHWTGGVRYPKKLVAMTGRRDLREGAISDVMRGD